jgi:hypothetical protein
MQAAEEISSATSVHIESSDGNGSRIQCRCGCVPNIMSLFEMAEKRAALKREREAARIKADDEAKLAKEMEK